MVWKILQREIERGGRGKEKGWKCEEGIYKKGSLLGEIAQVEAQRLPPLFWGQGKIRQGSAGDGKVDPLVAPSALMARDASCTPTHLLALWWLFSVECLGRKTAPEG